MKSESSFLRLNLRVIGPFMYFDFKSYFFLIVNPAFTRKRTRVCVGLHSWLFDLTKRTLTMSPLTLYLYLNPLYSIRGGSTTRDEPFTKNPIDETFRWNPLYSWNILIQRTLVLSVINNHDSLYNSCTFLRANRNCTCGNSVMSRFQDYLKAR